MRLVAAALLCALNVLAQGNFVYTNNDRAPQNSVSAFSITASGALLPVPGSPFPTGGIGTGSGLFGANRIAISNHFLYVSNTASNNVSGFSINAVTGALIAIPGSPFAGAGSAGSEIALTATPDGKFLIAANARANAINVFNIAANGALSPVAGSPFVGGGAGIKVTPDGKFLAIAREGSNVIFMFSISATGGLTPVAGSPFPAGGGGSANSVDCNCASTRLFIGQGFSSLRVSVQNIGLNGALSPVAGSPFAGPGQSSVVAVLTPDDGKLLSSSQDGSTVSVWNVDPAGALTVVPNSPFAVTGSVFPSGMATNAAGTFLYVADFNNLISAFSVAGNGALTPVTGSPFSNGFPGETGLMSLAVFPPKSCAGRTGDGQSCPVPLIGAASATPNVLWPPNHKYVDVRIDYGVTDPCPNKCVLTVSSSEPEHAAHDGRTSPAWQVIDAHHVSLIAERSEEGKERIYTIRIGCTNDANGQSSSRIVTVIVPANMGH